MWFFEMYKVLLNLDFVKYEWYNCSFNYGNHILLLLYVDDIALFWKIDQHISKILKLLTTKFDAKVLGETKKLLGVEFEEMVNDYKTLVLISQMKRY